MRAFFGVFAVHVHESINAVALAALRERCLLCKGCVSLKLQRKMLASVSYMSLAN